MQPLLLHRIKEIVAVKAIGDSKQTMTHPPIIAMVR